MFKYLLVSILSISVLSVQAEKAVDSDALGLMLSNKSTMEAKDCNFFEKNSQGKKVRSQKQISCILNDPSSGYPEAYESKKATHIKEFPFLIQKTIEQRDGIFRVSEQGKAHVEIDGRLVTGQNYHSSALVAEKIIAILEKS